MRGHIRKRGKESWAIVVDIGHDTDGKRHRKWHSFRGTKRDAQKEMTRILELLRTGSYVEPSQLTVGEYLEQWLAAVRNQIAAKTFVRYQEIVRRHLVPAFGGLKLEKLHPLQIETCYSKALISGRLDGKGGLSPQTVKHHHRVLSEALRKAVRLQILIRNPCDSVDPPKPAYREAHALSQEEATKLIVAAEETRLYLPIVLAITTGLRRGEMLGLMWEDIDDTTLAVRRKIEQTRLEGVQARQPKTKKSVRTIALPAFVVKLLRRHEVEQKKIRLMIGAGYRDNGYMFPEVDGSVWYPDRFTSSFRNFVKKSGLPHVTYHELRHYVPFLTMSCEATPYWFFRQTSVAVST